MLTDNLSLCDYSNYTLILQHLFIISQSTKSQNGRVMDNICAAICRMIMARQDTIPLEQVRRGDLSCNAVLTLYSIDVSPDNGVQCYIIALVMQCYSFLH